jgi:hypothetical protein
MLKLVEFFEELFLYLFGGLCVALVRVRGFLQNPTMLYSSNHVLLFTNTMKDVKKLLIQKLIFFIISLSNSENKPIESMR